MEPVITLAVVAATMGISKLAIDAVKSYFSKSKDNIHRLIVKDEAGNIYNIEVEGDTSPELSEELKNEITRSVESRRSSR
jgi:hypothetical protein